MSRASTSDHASGERRIDAVLDLLARGHVQVDDALIELADADCDAGLARLVAERIGLGFDTVQWALETDSDEPMTVLCRSAGLNLNSYSAILRLRRRRYRGPDNTPSAALSLFSSLSAETAKQTVNRIKAREQLARTA